MRNPTIFFGADVSATSKTLRRWVARSRSHWSYIPGMSGRKEYLAGSHDSCSLHNFSTIGSTAGTSSALAARISIKQAYEGWSQKEMVMAVRGGRVGMLLART